MVLVKAGLHVTKIHHIAGKIMKKQFVVKNYIFNQRRNPAAGKVVATFVKKAQAKSYVQKMQPGNLGCILLIEKV